MATIYLKRGRAKAVWLGHPWVFSGAIERQEGTIAPGDAVEVRDCDGKVIGWGLVNPRSQLAVRMMTRGNRAIDDALVIERISQAAALRRRLGLPNDETNAYRLVNSEGDGLPGLVVDVYGEVAAVQFTALGMKRREAVIYDALVAALGARVVVEVAAGSFAQLEGFQSASRVTRGALDGVVPCRELGIALEAEPLNGQKTGLYLDQRENRRRVGELARGARVLDVYTYAGGFALAALRGGAAEATAVDTSARALERARRHGAMNQLGPLTLEEVDAFRFLEQVRPRSFDLVVVDPPKFARARKDLPTAIKGYQRLNALALNACADDALLFTCSCSQLVEGETLERIIAAAAQDAGRRIELLEVRSQGPDHPLLPSFPEGRYLTGLLCRIMVDH